MKITNIGSGEYFVETGIMTADIRPIEDICILTGNVLRTLYDGETVHTVPPIRIILGPKSLAIVSALHPNEQVVF